MAFFVSMDKPMRGYQVPEIQNTIFQVSLDVRIQNINYGQHLGHDALISLLHEARLQLLSAHQYSELNVEGKGMLVTNLYINYLQEAFYGDRLQIEIGVRSMTHATLDLLYAVYNTKTHNKIARAETTMAFFDPARRKVCKIPQAFLEKLQKSPSHGA